MGVLYWLPLLISIEERLKYLEKNCISPGSKLRPNGTANSLQEKDEQRFDFSFLLLSSINTFLFALEFFILEHTFK